MINFVMSLACSFMLFSTPVQAQSQELSYSQLLLRTHDLRYLCELPAADERTERLRLDVVDGQVEHVINGPAVISRLFVDAVDGSVVISYNDDQLEINLSDTSKIAAAPLISNLGSATAFSLPITVASNATVSLKSTTAQHLDLDIWYPGMGVTLPNSSNKFLRSQRRDIRRTVELLVANQNPSATTVPDPKKIGAAYFRSADRPPSSTNGNFRWLIHGAGVVRWLELKFIHKEEPAAIEEMLRSLVLRIEHGSKSIEDDATAISEVPLGDFFCAYRGANNNNNYLIGYNEESKVFYCRLPIPYRDNLRLTVVSDIVEPARFVMRAGIDKLALPDVPPLTLHADYVRAVGSGMADGAQLHVEGVVRLIGAMFSSTTSSSQQVIQDNDFSFVNAQQIPTLNFSEQVLLHQGPGVFGNNSFMRWYHAASPSSLTELKYDPQLKIASDAKTDYSFSTWWYGNLDSAAVGATAYPVEQRLHAKNPQPSFFTIPNVVEAEHNMNYRMSNGSSMGIELADNSLNVSSLQFTKWMPSSSMQAVVFDFSIADSGTHDFKLQLMTGPEFGKVQVLIDGAAIGEVIDCSAEVDGVSGLLDLGSRRMMARESHTIGFRSVDEKPVGIDCYLVQAVKK
ncbi:MAG: DUF2961 domain-containing protein [Planctomycetes bacterium]|nr:DUF2961 domain-containing protein [Planctomycetota bacterium]